MRTTSVRQHHRYTIGVDVGGGSHDPSVFAVIHHEKVEHMDDDGAVTTGTRHVIEALRRLRPDATQRETAEEAVALGEEVAQYGSITLVVDSTGVGLGAAQMIADRTSLPVRAVVLTGGVTESEPDAFTLHAPKIEVLSRLKAELDEERLLIVPSLALAEDWDAEMRHFSRRITKHGVSGEAERGKRKHDDLVVATGLAVYFGTRKENRQHREFMAFMKRSMARQSGLL